MVFSDWDAEFIVYLDSIFFKENIKEILYLTYICKKIKKIFKIIFLLSFVINVQNKNIFLKLLFCVLTSHVKQVNIHSKYA